MPFYSEWKDIQCRKNVIYHPSACVLMENPCHIALWQLESDAHTVILCHSVVFITCTRLFPFPPPSDIMGQSKVTHIYPIIRGFEKTHIKLQLMLQWGPESERCSRPKRLGFQGPANKSSPVLRERKGEMGGAMGWECVESVALKQ